MGKEEKELAMEELLRSMEALARGSINDAVKLAFLDGARLEEIGALDLTALSEFKRSANGAVEVKLIDRLLVLERLAGLLSRRREGAAELFQTLEKTAEAGEISGAEGVFGEAEAGPVLVV